MLFDSQYTLRTVVVAVDQILCVMAFILCAVLLSVSTTPPLCMILPRSI